MQKPVELDDDTAFGARLRAERERLGMQVHELAHLCGRVDLVQKRYEAGSLPIPADYLQALHVRSDVDVWYVLTGQPGASR
jgi:transcriptional regulator with XRE-family HTH domain